MTRVLYAAAALVLVALVMAGIRREGATEARAVIAERLSDSLYVEVLNEKKHRHEDSLRNAIHVVILTDSLRKEIARADRAEASRPAMVRGVVERHADGQPDSVKAIVQAAVTEAVESVVANEVKPLRSALAISDSLLAVERAERAAVSKLSEQRLRALDATRAEAAAWEKASRPKLFGLIPVSPNGAFGGGVLATAGVVVWMVLR